MRYLQRGIGVFYGAVAGALWLALINEKFPPGHEIGLIVSAAIVALGVVSFELVRRPLP